MIPILVYTQKDCIMPNNDNNNYNTDGSLASDTMVQC